MRRASLLFASQIISFITGVIFPILFVKIYGHAAYGDAALAVAYAGFFLTFVAGAIGQSILERGIGLKRFRQLLIGFELAAFSVWLLSLSVGQSGFVAMSLAVIYILCGQSSLHLVYYYAIRRNKEIIFTSLFGIETIPRVLTLLVAPHLLPSTLPAMLGSYVISTGVTVAGALFFMGSDDEQVQGILKASTALRFLRWALSGVLISNFDRTFYASSLDDVSRSVYLFFSSLYNVAFSLIANSVSLEVLATRRTNAVASKLGFYVLAILGTGSAALATALVFKFGGWIGKLTEFDPNLAVAPVLFTFAFRSLLFIQQLAYGYIERGGRTLHASRLRAIASFLLLAMWPVGVLVGRGVIGMASLVVMLAVSIDAWISVSRFYGPGRTATDNPAAV